MRTRYLMVKWLVPALGAAGVFGGLLAAAMYVDLERQDRAQAAFGQTVECLWQEQKLCLALKLLQDGDAEGAAERVDALLSRNIARLNDELTSADTQTLEYVEETRQRMRLSPSATAGETTAGSGEQPKDEPVVASKPASRAPGAAEVAGKP